MKPLASALILIALCSPVRYVFAQSPTSNQGQTTKSPADILKDNDSAVALIVSADDSSASLGSGFFIGDGSAVVTNFHVIAGAQEVVVKSGSGQIFHVTSVYAYDEHKDLAVLKVGSSGSYTVKLGDSDKALTGFPVVVIGNPEGLEKSISNGLISGVRTFEGQKLFQISAPVSHGSSGGPVFNDKGEVIAVVCAFLSDGQNLNFAIPINEVKVLWEKRHEISLASLPSPTPSRPTPDMDGAWVATFADSLSSGTLSFTLMQDGNSVRGTYTSSVGGGGTLSGQIAGNKFTFNLTQSVKDCPGNFIGSANLRSGTMIGDYSGTDCQGSHSNGTFSMTKGLAPVQPAAAAPTTAQPAASASTPAPVIEYGTPAELKGVKTVFIYGVDPDLRNNMLKQFAKHPELRVVGDIGSADVVLVFGAATFYRGTYTNVWSDSNGNVYGNSIPRYGVTGQGSAAKFIPPNRVRVIWQFSATRVNVFQRRPSTNFVRDFIDAWKKANQ